MPEAPAFHGALWHGRLAILATIRNFLKKILHKASRLCYMVAYYRVVAIEIKISSCVFDSKPGHFLNNSSIIQGG
jgi:hypothetical protein